MREVLEDKALVTLPRGEPARQSVKSEAPDGVIIATAQRRGSPCSGRYTGDLSGVSCSFSQQTGRSFYKSMVFTVLLRNEELRLRE